MKRYIPIKGKFVLTVLIAVAWMLVCFWIDKPWFDNLSRHFGIVIAVMIVFGTAILPGIMICFFSIGGLAFDKPRHQEVGEVDDITVLIAAYNEEDAIYETLKSISLQHYPGNMRIVVIDNNSKDHTKDEIYRAIENFPGLNIEYLFEGKQGKYAALNRGLEEVKTKYYISIDADTYLYRGAIERLVEYMVKENKNKKVGAIAGTILVRNSRVNLLTKLQEWEYFLSIATIKRSQGLFQTTMVAQGAFSIYDTEMVRSVGGYQDAIAEDIVLTWSLLDTGENIRSFYCDNAIAFTNVPTEWGRFLRQRFRWARGSIEGFKAFNWWKCGNWYTRFYMLVNYVNIMGEVATTFVLIPGILALVFMHNTLLVGPSTVVLFLVTVVIYLVMWRKQMKYVFEPLGLKVRRHYWAFVVYMLVYAIVLAPTCLWGYIEGIVGSEKKWK